MTVTYEVTSIVRVDLCHRWEAYMTGQHVADVLATGCFGEASLGRSAPGRYRMRYEALSRATLQRYLSEHAPRLRAHFAAAFPEGVEVEREVWDVLSTW